ncbi:MAG: adenosylcobinamide-GDP ribazoletransferase [Chloroflexi bacterium]|nr:adenosylcobinamide-GDP ribazoletransferase [Chloroflexota bacterium]
MLLFGRWASKRLGGGLTGDTYGAVCELVELVCLIFLV